ncbi:MAG: hypothetical protein II453_19950 [Alphaproteobacteria bacterium]|nr:hypothetical protein [Alphaproteobacteria bacterium]
MNIRKHLLNTSATFMLLASTGGAVTSEVLDEEPTTIDEYVFKENTVFFKNPCYKASSSIEDKIGLKTVETVEITNGSPLNFATNGPSGNVIRAFSKVKKAANPLGLSHSGFVVNLDPRELYGTILDVMPGGSSHTIASLSEKAGRAVLRELEDTHRGIISAVHYPNVKASFAIESFGSVGEIMRGIAPHVHIRDLSKRLQDFSGNVFVRPMYESVSSEITMDFMKEYLGRPYESIANLKEIVGSVADLNKEERVDNVFCSELVSLFYKKCGVFDDSIISNNVIPGLLGSGAGNNDLLKGKASADIPLKVSFAMYHPEDGQVAPVRSSFREWINDMLVKLTLSCCTFCGEE